MTVDYKNKVNIIKILLTNQLFTIYRTKNTIYSPLLIHKNLH